MKYRILPIKNKFHVQKRNYLKWETIDSFHNEEDAQECYDFYVAKHEAKKHDNTHTKFGCTKDGK